MELRQLRAFLYVANTRHFGRAAKELRITQPALTQRIQSLERELRVQLFERSAREVQLTAPGKVLLPYANSLIQVENLALRDLADNAAGRAGSLRIAYLLHGDVGTQGKIVAEFRRRYQDVTVETSVSSSKSNLDHLQTGDVDAAFIASSNVGTDVVTKQTGRRALVLALPTDHPLAKLERVPASSLRGVPMIIWPREWNPEIATSFRQWLTRNIGEEPNIVAEEPTEQAFAAVAASGSTVTVASSWRDAVAPIAGIALRPLVPQPLLDHEIAYMRHNPSPALQNLLRITDEIANTNHHQGEALEGDLL
jgi:DNA-binding transcriptional LysR family regulator